MGWLQIEKLWIIINEMSVNGRIQKLWMLQDIDEKGNIGLKIKDQIEIGNQQGGY